MYIGDGSNEKRGDDEAPLVWYIKAPITKRGVC